MKFRRGKSAKSVHKNAESEKKIQSLKISLQSLNIKIQSHAEWHVCLCVVV